MAANMHNNSVNMPPTIHKMLIVGSSVCIGSRESQNPIQKTQTAMPANIMVSLVFLIEKPPGAPRRAGCGHDIDMWIFLPA